MSTRRKKRRRGRKKAPCDACGEPTALLIPRGPFRACRDCVTLSGPKFRACREELDRINAQGGTP